jgi:acyl carrier protein
LLTSYMGAWGIGNFENDTIQDWIIELVEAQDINLLSESIEMVLEDNYLDADVACIAIGAVEILAALQNRPGKEINEDELQEWILQHKGQGTNLLEKSHKALGKILAESELKELWEKTEDYGNWVTTIKELQSRIII